MVVSAQLPHQRLSLLTMVDCQNLATVHFNKAAQRKLCMADPQLLGPLISDALQNKATQVDPAQEKGPISGSSCEAGHTLWWLWSTRPPITYALFWSSSSRTLGESEVRYTSSSLATTVL